MDMKGFQQYKEQSVNTMTQGELLLLCDTLERDGQVRPALWRCVEDLTVCGPRDRVFTYDPIRETVTFGDGLRGAVPAAGEGAEVAGHLGLSRCGGGGVGGGARGGMGRRKRR